MTEKNKEYDNPWIYNDSPLLDIPKNAYGFVYNIIDSETGKMYIGRKYFYTKRKKKGQKRKTTEESNWKLYYGSCKPLLEIIKKSKKDRFIRKIISIHDTIGQVNYHEIAEQFKRDVLFSIDESGERLYYNDNILSRYFAKRIKTEE